MRAPFRLLLVTDRKLLPDAALVPVAEAALAGGVDAVQLREKDLPARDLLALATQLRALTRRYAAALLINDRVDIALAVNADGVHLPANSFAPKDARALLGVGSMIGVSTHSLDDALAAENAGADYVVFGPLFDTPSKRPYGSPIGVPALTSVVSRLQIPVIGIGGITPARAAEVREAGAAGVAVVSAILSQYDPCAAATALRG